MAPQGKVVVGLTGSFGSGKSTVAKIFKRLGARKVIDCDRLAHEVFGPNHPIGKKIKTLFGEKGGRLNRKSIARAVFSDPRKRRQLEALVHPYVYKRIREELGKIRGGIVILEVPLLFETGFDEWCDATVSISAPRQAVLDRLRARGFGTAEVGARLKAQLSSREKMRRAHFHIWNSGSKQQLMKRTKSLWEKLTSK